ncbi:MAG TPA: DUF423 domain-containing protein [Bacteroidia bacterium]|jgi:uncharacterized membrane protein YgdD (TMEM256/DUF423 family)
MQKRFLVFSGFSGAIAVALGAMAAHFLKSKLETGLITEANLLTFETAAKYQMYHSIALLGLALLFDKYDSKLISKVGYCFMAGIVLFSGSLYLLATAGLLNITSVRWLGPITPIGGLFFIAGWLLLAYTGLKKTKNKEQ